MNLVLFYIWEDARVWAHRSHSFFKKLLYWSIFYIEVYPINNVVIVPGGQQRDSAKHIPVSILPQTPLPSRLPHNIEQSSYAIQQDLVGYPF